MSTLAISFAGSAAFAAAMPLLTSVAVPRAVRASIALMLMPLVASRLEISQSCCDTSVLLIRTLTAAVTGAACGLSAAAMAGAAAAAGGLIDAALAAPPFGRDNVFGAASGPFGRLYPLAFALVFFGSGACTRVIERFVDAGASAAGPIFSAGTVAAIGRASIGSAVALAGPVICAQGLAAVLAAVLTRVAPRINGMLLGTPLASGLVILVTVAGSKALFSHLMSLSALTVRATAGAH